jgi:hypothetical protein
VSSAAFMTGCNDYFSGSERSKAIHGRRREVSAFCRCLHGNASAAGVVMTFVILLIF